MLDIRDETDSFTQWLARQVDRDDLVGDLARDARDDETWPKIRRAMCGYVKYLDGDGDGRGACPGAYQALRDAWREYMECWVTGELKGAPHPPPEDIEMEPEDVFAQELQDMYNAGFEDAQDDN